MGASVHPSYAVRLQFPCFCTRPQQVGLLQQSPDRLATHSHPASPVSPNAAARLISNPRRCDHITEALISRHWAPRARANYIQGGDRDADVSCLHGSAPPYLASFTCVADMPHRRKLRSASTEQLDVPTCRRSTIGGRAFSVAGAKVWNSLPSDVTSASSLPVFKNRLKTYLFRRCYETL